MSDPPTITLRNAIKPTVDQNNITQPATITILEDKSTKDDSTDSKLLEFDVTDAVNETPPDKLVIAKASSNTDLIPADDAHITIAGTGTRRTLVVTPAANKNGTSVITLTVTDESGLSASAKFTNIVTAVNDAPTIDQVSNISLNEGAAEETVNLSNVTVGPDSGQAIKSVSVAAKDKRSDNTVVNNLIDITSAPGLPDSNGKTSFKFRPKNFVSGTAILTVTVVDDGKTDNDGKDTTTMSFEVAIADVNQSPTISFDNTTSTKAITRSLDPDVATGVIPFYINDVETSGPNLTLTKSSSNPALIPLDGIVFGGSGNTRSIIVTPATGKGGTGVVTITVTDGNGATDSATLTLNIAAGQNPTITLNPTSQQVSVNGFSDLIQVTVSDAQTTNPDNLLIGYQAAGLVTSDNPTLVPVSSANIQFGGSGANRLMIIQPAANQTGTANIGVGVKDTDGHITFATFTLKVLGSAPTISSVTDQQANSGQTIAVQVTVGDKETFPGFLTVTGSSSDQTIIPNSNINAFTSSGATKTVAITAGTKGGTTAITLKVTDGEGQTATTTFNVTVSDNNTAPTITPITDQSTTVGKATGLINFTIGDKETAVGSLTVAATSSNTDVLPNTGILILQSATSPSSRSLILTPAAGRKGSSLVTVTVTDGGSKTATSKFNFTVSDVSAANDLNGDGVPDILLQDDAGYLGAWLMSGDTVRSSVYLTPNNVGDAGWRAVDIADFTGDAKPDILFQYTDGSLAVWQMDGTKLVTSGFLSPSNTGGKAWKAIACGDFDKDGKADILFQNTDGTLAVWLMNGLTLSSVATLTPSNPGKGWNAVGVADINGDKNLDIVFQNTDGTLAVWYLQKTTQLLLSALLDPATPGSADWRVVGTTDLNGDGKSDLLLQNRATGDVALWYMNGPKLLLGKLLTPSNPGGTWKFVAP